MSEGDDFTVFMPEYDKLLTTVCEQNRRMQAIADVPKCVHGNIYPHSVAASGEAWKRGVGRMECVGSPKLAGLLDALTEENK